MEKESVLKSLDRHVVQKAFEQVQREINVPGARLVHVDEPYYKQAMDSIRDHFVMFEPIHVGCGVQWVPEVEDYWMDVVKEDLSLMLVAEDTGETMAILVNRIAPCDEHVDLDTIHHQPQRDNIDFLQLCEEEARFFSLHGIKHAFHFIAVAVAPSFRQRGLASRIVRSGIDMVKYLNVASVAEPVYIKAEGSSNFSKLIFEKSEFYTLYEKSYATYKIDDRVVVPNTGEHESMRMYGLKVV